MTTLESARAAAYAAYATARATGHSPNVAAQAAWFAARGMLRHLRAPHWSEQVAANSGSRRSYRSPLGTVLGVGAQEYGHHSAKWRRTVRSERAARVISAHILAHLEATLVSTSQAA